MKPPEKTAENLRRFGYVMALVLALFSAAFLWRGRATAFVIATLLVSYFLTSAVLAPQTLRSVERWWMRLGMKLGAVVTVIILTVAYFVLVTPLGFLLRLLGKDILALRLDRSAASYWSPCEEEGPQTRADVPY